MGLSISIADKVQPTEFVVSPEDKHTTPIKRRNRKTTDILFLLLHAAVLLSLVPLVLNCVYHGNINRIIYGYDSCGNICGRQNYLPNSNKKTVCDGLDMIDKPYILVQRTSINPDSLKHANNEATGIQDEGLTDMVDRICLSNCSEYPNYYKVLNRCVIHRGKGVVSNYFYGRSGLKDFFEEVAEDFERCWRELVYLWMVSLAFSITITILLRFVVGIVIWLILMCVLLVCVFVTAYLWFLWNLSSSTVLELDGPEDEVESKRNGTYLAFAIAATIITLCVILIILVMRKRIQLVIQLFKEAGKAVAAMPLLLFQPAVTFVCIAIITAAWIYFALWIESAGFKKETRPGFYVYEKDFWILFTRWCNVFISLWMVQFSIGCQHMVIAGATSAWYFSRNKDKLGTPIYFGFYNLTRYHLGSVSFGSFLIAVIQFIRLLLLMLQKFISTHNGKCVECLVKCCQCCLCCLEKIIKFITRNAFIEIAIHGYNFCRASRQAFKILTSNALRFATINSVGDFVLFLGKVVVIMATVLVGIELIQKKDGVMHGWVLLVLSGLFAYLISHCFLSVYEMAIDTIFICFCEDCQENDGNSKPYYMSRGLMEFVENSNVRNFERLRQPAPTSVMRAT